MGEKVKREVKTIGLEKWALVVEERFLKKRKKLAKFGFIHQSRALSGALNMNSFHVVEC